MFITEFVDWSLAQAKKPKVIGSSEGAKAKKPPGNEEYWSFVVHDLIIGYLRDTISEEDTRGYHQGLVNKYRIQCNGKFPKLKPDGYIHQQLLYHLEQAGDHVTRTSLLSDLCWLRACLSHCSSSVVLSWYIRECIGEVCMFVYVCVCVGGGCGCGWMGACVRTCVALKLDILVQ